MSDEPYSQYPRGAEWRKWDLHVHTRTDNNYTCLGTNSLARNDMSRLVGVTGLTEAQISSQEKELSKEQYARLFVHYISEFTDVSVVAVTNHNSAEGVDEIIDESRKCSRSLTVIPGVEIASNQGIHILCLFDPKRTPRESWDNEIDHFLTEIGITGDSSHRQRAQAADSAQSILERVERKGGVCIFAHISNDNGLFQRSNTATSGTAHIDIYKHTLCRLVQIRSSGNLEQGVQNIIAGRDPQYGSKPVVKCTSSDNSDMCS